MFDKLNYVYQKVLKIKQNQNNVATVLKTEISPLAIYSAQSNGPEIRAKFR